MRDERWVNRFLFAWNDTLYFDPLDVSYRPRADHFLADLEEKVRSRFIRSGIWWSYRHNPSLPAQGWKIHVSASSRDVHRVAASTTGYLLKRGVDFKIALDLNIFEMINSKGMSRGSGGKLITIYPGDDGEFLSCLADLAVILDGAEGAYILSDMRYKDCKCLYFRYGQLLDTHIVNAMGRKVPHIAGPEGLVPDDRRPGYSQPSWVPWPFSDWKPADETDSQDDLLGGRFRVTGALQFSNSGGVYQAEDTADGDRQVILKEARPHANLNPRKDYDAVDILAREWTFLNRLSGTGAFPRPIATFRHWEHQFIAEEFIDGTDIRAMLLEHNPLAGLGEVDPEQSRRFLRIFCAVCRSLAHAVQAAHDLGVVLGDLTAANLLVDPETYKVTVIDLESCRLAEAGHGEEHLESPVELYTPGFSHSRLRNEASTPKDDLYGLATTMAYFIFPIAAMSYLREDVFPLYRTFIDGLGWPADLHEAISGLAQDRVSLAELLALLDKEEDLVERVNVPPRPPMDEERLGLSETEAGVALFMELSADTGRDTLFSVDPFAHLTNPLSLGFGASGILWALEASGVPISPEWRGWLRDRIDKLDPSGYPCGLMNGLAGIAWAIDGLGLRGQARELLATANQSASRTALDTNDYTYYYGLAGLGMANLHFYLNGRNAEDLAAAQACARALRDTAQRDGDCVYWTNEFATQGPLTGLGFGQAGVAMFLLRMYQITGDESYVELGRRALSWELAHAQARDDGTIGFGHHGTLEPYVEVGSAGVAQVLLRYGELDAARKVLRGLDAGYSILPGYSFGMSGIAGAMLDAATILEEPSYRDTALRQLEYVRKVFLFEPAERFAVPRRAGVIPLAVPGEGLLRCACDLLTGSAGVLRVLHRVNRGGTADFLLDEIRS